MQLIVTSYLSEEYLLNWSFRVTLPWPVLFILKFVLTVAPEELMCPTRSLRFDEGLYVSDRLENCNVQYVIWLWNLLNTKWGSIFYINIIVKKKKIFSYIIYFTTFSKYFVYDYTKLFLFWLLMIRSVNWPMKLLFWKRNSF